MATPGETATRKLLARAHSPTSVERIYGDKIQHRPLLLKPSSPPPATLNARAVRRHAREQRKEKKKLRPRPLSARERKRLDLYDIPRQGQKYAIYEPLYHIWQGYIREILGKELFSGGPATAGKLASAEFHGARIEVVRSRCPSRVGIAGIVVRDRKFVFEVITAKNNIKMVPKEGTTFRVEVVNVGDGSSSNSNSNDDATMTGVFAFELLGDQLQHRSADRANRKFKAHFLKNL